MVAQVLECLMDEARLLDLINAAWDRMSFPEKKLWEAVHVSPEKWSLAHGGKNTDAFWVVALIGPTVIWYNHVEEGFNRSRFDRYGEIAEYGSNQFDLEEALRYVLNQLKAGYALEPRSGAPIPGEFK